MKSPDAPAPPGDETRVTLVTGDRLCVQCGYNLIGQFVLREPHHGLLIVRCPECATVACVQEYPRLGRWASRWGTLLAVLWFIVLLGAWFGSSAAVFGWSMASAEEGARDYGTHIQKLVAEEQQRRAGATPGPVAPPANLGGGLGASRGLAWGVAFQEWWLQQDHDAVLADAGGFPGAINGEVAWMMIPGFTLCFVVGWFWSVALLHVRRRWLPLWALSILAMASLFLLFAIWDWNDDVPSWTWSAARQALGPPVAVAALAFSALPLAVGLWLGRPLTRGCVRMLLPPRLRGCLTLLWTAEGRPIPRGRRVGA
jgi:hypothetical protein